MQGGGTWGRTGAVRADNIIRVYHKKRKKDLRKMKKKVEKKLSDQKRHRVKRKKIRDKKKDDEPRSLGRHNLEKNVDVVGGGDSHVVDSMQNEI